MSHNDDDEKNKSGKAKPVLVDPIPATDPDR